MYELYSNLYKEEFLNYYGQEELSEANINKVKELLEKSGSKKYAENVMNTLYDEGIKQLKNISWMNPSKKQILEGFIEYLRKRNK